MPLCSCSFFGESSCLIFQMHWSPHTALNHVDDVITSAIVGGFDTAFLVSFFAGKGVSCFQ